MFGGQARAGRHRHRLVEVDVLPDRAGLLGASEERSERSP
jgi:hypothetical protein